MIPSPGKDNGGPVRSAGEHAWTRWGFTCAFVAAVLCYLNAVRGAFLFDDIPLVVENHSITSLSHAHELLLSGVGQAFGRVANYYRPLPSLLFMVVYAVFGLRPEPFHLVNIALHAATTGLVFLVTRRLLEAGRPSYTAGWPALAAALVFATHPLHVEAVAWISGVMDVACAFFSMLALWLYVRSDGGETGRTCYVLSLVALLLALLSKEPAAVVPFLLLGWDLLLRPEPLRSIGSAVRRWIPPFGAVVIYLALRTVALRSTSFGRPEPGAGLAAALANIPGLFALYLEKLALPLKLTIQYDCDPIPWGRSLDTMKVSFILAAFLALVGLAVRGRKALMLALLALTLPLVPALYSPALALECTRVFAERYAYFPSVGFSLLLGVGLASLAARGSRAYRAALVVTLSVSILFAAATIDRNRVWENSVALWSDAVRKGPHLPIPRFNLGVALEQEGRFVEAIHQLETVLRMHPDYAEAHNNLAVLYAQQGRLDLALPHFEAAARLRPEDQDYRMNLERARRRRRRAVRRSPSELQFARRLGGGRAPRPVRGQDTEEFSASRQSERLRWTGLVQGTRWRPAIGRLCWSGCARSTRPDPGVPRCGTILT